MSAEKLDEILRNHRTMVSRLAFLRSQMEMLERFLGMCMRTMVSDQVSLSQAMTGMPHGSGTSDPTGRLAIDIASGKVSVFVQQIQDEIEETRSEMQKASFEVHVVEIVMDALSERERAIVRMKAIDCLSWAEIIGEARKTQKGASKRTLQRDFNSAMHKAYEIVR